MATTFQTSQLQCPFCEATFKRLGCHIYKCPKREGRDYYQYLSQKTLNKKKGKATKKACPKCNKMFSRLDTHLKSNAFCKTIAQQEVNLSVREQQTEKQHPPDSVTTSDTSMDMNYEANILPRCVLPSSEKEWQETDLFIKTNLLPKIVRAVTVDD